MPELPEVQIIVNDLQKYIVNSTIDNVVLMANYRVFPSNEDFKYTSTNQRIKKASRIGKNIVFELENNYYITIHLAMTGNLLFKKDGVPQHKHTRAKFLLSKKQKPFELHFKDTRMFGKIKIHSQSQFEDFVKKYGPDPLDANLDHKIFEQRLKSKNTNIKNALLDQKIISGMGNAYVTDALFLAKLNPQNKTQDISSDQYYSLFEASKQVLSQGIKNRGISMSDYVDLFGNKGTQQKHFKIYKQKVCPTCSTQVQFITLNGRGTYFCSNCQPKVEKGLFE